MGFPSVGNRLLLDFVATLGKRGTRNLERLGDPADLTRWGEHVGVGAVGDADADALDAARELREALYRLCEHALGRRHPQQPDVDVVNAWASLPPPPAALTIVNGQLVRQDPAPTTAGLLAAVARDAVDLFIGGDVERLRECEGETCTLLFVDVSRDGRRRWCSMDSCGAQAKMRALRSRRRAEP
jgi:predicted RNA-binding Zn ribbon-like protein